MPACKPSTKILPAMFAWSVLISCSLIFYACALPSLTVVHSPAITVYVCLLTLYVVANFGLSTFMDPGVYPKARSDEAKYDDGRSAPLFKNIEVNGIQIRMKWCATCQMYRPPRCSHCSVCNCCIETFDHHCPWVNNCIGRSNYRFFVQFLVSLVIYILTILAFSLVYVLENSSPFATPNNILLVIVMVVSGLLSIPICGLLGFHLVLIARGRTTNEQMTGKIKKGLNPYTRGCWKNYQYVLCGPSWPKLTGREIMTASRFDADGVRLMYRPAASGDQRLYIETQNGNMASKGQLNGKQQQSVSYGAGTLDISQQTASSLCPLKRSDEFENETLQKATGGSAHSLTGGGVGIAEISGFGFAAIPTGPLAGTATTPTSSLSRAAARQHSRTADIRAPIATSEELSPMSPMSQDVSQSGELMQLLPQSKTAAKVDNSGFDAKPKAAAATVGVSASSNVLNDSLAGRSRHPRMAGTVQPLPSATAPRAMIPLQTQPSVSSSSNTASDVMASVLGAVRRPATLGQAAGGTSAMSGKSRPTTAAQRDDDETASMLNTSNVLEISV